MAAQPPQQSNTLQKRVELTIGWLRKDLIPTIKSTDKNTAIIRIQTAYALLKQYEPPNAEIWNDWNMAYEDIWEAAVTISERFLSSSDCRCPKNKSHSETCEALEKARINVLSILKDHVHSKDVPTFNKDVFSVLEVWYKAKVGNHDTSEIFRKCGQCAETRYIFQTMSCGYVPLKPPKKYEGEEVEKVKGNGKKLDRAESLEDSSHSKPNPIPQMLWDSTQKGGSEGGGSKAIQSPQEPKATHGKPEEEKIGGKVWCRDCLIRSFKKAVDSRKPPICCNGAQHFLPDAVCCFFDDNLSKDVLAMEAEWLRDPNASLMMQDLRVALHTVVHRTSSLVFQQNDAFRGDLNSEQSQSFGAYGNNGQQQLYPQPQNYQVHRPQAQYPQAQYQQAQYPQPQYPQAQYQQPQYPQPQYPQPQYPQSQYQQAYYPQPQNQEQLQQQQLQPQEPFQSQIHHTQIHHTQSHHTQFHQPGNYQNHQLQYPALMEPGYAAQHFWQTPSQSWARNQYYVPNQVLWNDHLINYRNQAGNQVPHQPNPALRSAPVTTPVMPGRNNVGPSTSTNTKQASSSVAQVSDNDSTSSTEENKEIEELNSNPYIPSPIFVNNSEGLPVLNAVPASPIVVNGSQGFPVLNAVTASPIVVDNPAEMPSVEDAESQECTWECAKQEARKRHSGSAPPEYTGPQRETK